MENHSSLDRKSRSVPLVDTGAKETRAPDKQQEISIEGPLDSAQILHLQRTIGNNAVQRLLKQQNQQPSNRKAIQRRERADETGSNDSQDQENTDSLENANQRDTSPDLHLVQTKRQTPNLIQRRESDGELDGEDSREETGQGRENGFQREAAPPDGQPSGSGIPGLQRSSDGKSGGRREGRSDSAPLIPDSVLPSLQRLAIQNQGNVGAIQRVTAKQVFKKIGIGVANLASESFIGPFTDLKHGIRMIWEHDDPDKVKKVKDRVKEEWIGDYKDHTWMKVIHAITTAVEKVGALAGAIALIATIASAFYGVAAPVAAIAGVIGVACAGLALILRTILAIASFKYPDIDKKMVITNFVGALGNLLGVISFGVGAGLSGGVKFGSEVSTTVGRDIGAGIAFSTGTKISSVVTDLTQAKRIPDVQRDGDDDKKPDENDPKVLELAQVLTQVEGIPPMEKKGISEDRQALNTDAGKYSKLTGKFSEMFSKNDELKSSGNEMQTSTSQMEDPEQEPDDDVANAMSEKDIKKLEERVTMGEQYIDAESKPNVDLPIPGKEKKKGFFGKLKDKVKSLGKSIKKGFSKFFARAKSAFARFKTFMKKLQLKIAGFVLKALGLDRDLIAAREQFQADAGKQEERAADVNTRESKVGEIESMMEPYK